MKLESKQRKPRFVVDTNVLVSGFLSRKAAPGRLLHAFEKKLFIFLLSDAVLAEYLRVLDYPRIRRYPGVTDDTISHITALFVRFADRIEVQSQFTVSKDPDDNKFLELAVDGNADILVSGDKSDLLSLKEIKGIPIVTATECIKRHAFGL